MQQYLIDISHFDQKKNRYQPLSMTKKNSPVPDMPLTRGFFLGSKYDKDCIRRSLFSLASTFFFFSVYFIWICYFEVQNHFIMVTQSQFNLPLFRFPYYFFSFFLFLENNFPSGFHVYFSPLDMCHFLGHILPLQVNVYDK